MVAFRLLQGVFGAAIVPLSQTFLLDINPREKAGQAMAMWGAGIMVGPIIGPTLGGWLTESYDWRWVFFINVVPGAAVTLAIIALVKIDKPNLPMLRRSAFACAPANAQCEVLAAAHYITPARGGDGAARQLCDLLLVANGQYAALLAPYCA